MRLQSNEGFIVLGKRKSFFTRRLAYFYRGLDAPAMQHLTKLLIAGKGLTDVFFGLALKLVFEHAKQFKLFALHVF